jgi:hypothetical protein
MSFSSSALLFKRARATESLTDAELIELGREFIRATEQLDAAIDDPRRTISYALLDRLGQTHTRILAAQSQTIEGLRVKARAVCWVRLGDLDGCGERNGLDMALSIVRDLIRLHDPQLECPGALKALVQDS